ncbi:MAG TPA: DedA family protein [Chloroflexota bacterium]|nr:DedA family protein [Chloroflexota bacterium]
MRRLTSGRRIRPADVVCVGGFVVSIVYPLALTPLEPWLLANHPVLVEALLGTIESLVTAGAFARIGRVALWAAVVVPLFAGDALDPFSWWVGRRYGKRLLTWAEADRRYGPLMARTDAFLRRWGRWALVLAYYQPLPNAVIYMAAGETGMSLPLFVLLDLIGTALFIVPVVLLGYALGQSAVNLAQLITRYAGISTAVLVVLVVGYNVWRSRRGR